MRKRPGRRPPAGAVALLRLFLPQGVLRDSILEELAFEHEKLAEGRGPGVAARWYWRQALSVCGRSTLDRIRRRSWGGPDHVRHPGDIHPGGPGPRALGALGHVPRDARHGLRQLLRHPGSTLAVVVSLALGIGANTAMFSVLNGLFLRPLHVDEPDDLTSIFTAPVGGGRYGNTSYLDYLDYRDRNQVFSGVAAYATAPMALAGGEVPTIVWGQVVSGDYFRVLGVDAALGRTFEGNGGGPGDLHPEVVLGYGTWRRVFGADPGIVGRTIRINDYPLTVVGVAPREFSGLTSVLEPALWAPLSMTAQVLPYSPNMESRSDPWLQLVGRRRPGVSLAQARAGMEALSTDMAAEFPTQRGREIVLESVDDGRLGGADATRGARRLMATLLGVVGLVLLVACFNVANLELAKAMGRRREVALRYCLGASRGRIVGQLLTESVLLALLGGVGGIAVGALSLRGLGLLQARAEVPLPIPAALDHRVLAMTLLLALATGILFGLAPALQVLRPRQAGALKERGITLGRSRGSRWTEQFLVGGQVALSLVLVVGAGLLIRSLSNTLAIDPGFQLREGLVVPLNTGYGQYEEEEGRALQRRIRNRISSLPEVESAALVAFVPLGIAHGHHDVDVEGYDPAPDERMLVKRTMVSADYFRTMGIPVVRGRPIDEGDTRDAALVAMVNETMAERYWPGRDPVGGRVRADLGRVYTVVGVIADGKYGSLTESPQPYLVLPMAQAEYVANATLVVRTKGDPGAVARTVSSYLRREVPGLPPPPTMTVSQFLEYSQSSARGPAVIVGVLGLLALVLASVGLYGVMAHSISQRTREFGVRLALGATGSSVQRMVLLGGMRIVGLGMVAGGVMALAASRVLVALLYDVDPVDPLSFAGAAALLLGVGLLASFVPARQAARSDPIASLRAE